MKKSLNRTLAMFMAVIMVCGVALSGVISQLQVNASDTVSASFYSEGASVAVNSETAIIRFGFILDTAGTEWTTCFENGHIKEGYTAGVLCLPYDLSNKGVNLTLDNNLVAIALLEDWIAMEDSKIIAYVQLDANQIPAGQEHRTLIVKGYITDASGNVVSYTEPVKASMSYVAYKNQSSFNSEQIAKYLKPHNVTVVSAQSKETVPNTLQNYFGVLSEVFCLIPCSL